MIEKLKFFREFKLSDIDRIAVITDKKWMQKIVSLEDKLFRNFDMRAFSLDQKEEALAFLDHSDV